MAAGWKNCLLTYYKPSAGGINGADGSGAAGVPIHDDTWGCAAPPAYPFGTLIEFSYRGKSTGPVPVLDRGGAIQGNHFDLTERVAKGLPGMVSAGRVNAKFRVVGTVKGFSGTYDPKNAAAFTAFEKSPESTTTLVDWKGLVDPWGLFHNLNPGNPKGDPNGSLGSQVPGINTLTGIPDAIAAVAKAIGVIAKFLFEWTRKLADPNTWMDAGKIALGLTMLLIALRRVFQVAT